MSKLPLPPEVEEYIKECKWQDEHYPKSEHMKKYEEMELEFIHEIFNEENHQEPTEQEIEEYRIELMKLKYLVDTWINEYFGKVEKEHKEDLEEKQ